MDPVEEFLKRDTMCFHSVDELEEPPIGGYEASILERMKRLATAVKATTAKDDLEQQKSIDWSLLCHWSTQYLTDPSCPPDLVDKMYRKKSAHEKIKCIFEAPELNAKIASDARKMVVENYNRGRKNGPKARQYLKKGLEAMTAKDYKKALENFNMGLICAPHPKGTDDPVMKSLYSMLFVSRSRAFKGLGKYPESWDDYREACELNQSSRFIETLLTTQVEICREVIAVKFAPKKSSDLPVDLDEFDFRKQDQSPYLSNALKPLKLEYKREKGRSVVTTESLDETGILIAEEAYVAWLAPPYYSKYCYHCQRSLKDRPFPCQSCVYVRYCSFKCQDNSWRSYHSLECKFMAHLKYLSIGQLAMRIIFMNKVVPSLESYKAYASRKPSSRENKLTFKKTLGDLLTLGTHENHRENLLTQCMFAAAFLTHLASNMAFILDEDHIHFGGLMFKLLAILKINVSSIADDNITISESDYCFVIEKKIVIGAGLFPTFALINHSCLPNCASAFIGTRIMVTATRPIKAREEVTISYLSEYDDRSYEGRHKLLIDRWHFSCTCPPCRQKIDC